jgi:hypothetical protein
MNHWERKSGTTVTLSLRDMITLGPTKIDVMDSPQFQATLNQLISESNSTYSNVSKDISFSLHTVATLRVTLNEFRVDFSGTLEAFGCFGHPIHGKWLFIGKMKFYDRYDFDHIKGGGYARNIQTAFVRTIGNGKDYDVVSIPVQVVADEKDGTSWAGRGFPTHVKPIPE